MACRLLAAGPAVDRCVHVVPFHSQVSPKNEPPPDTPPNRTVTPRALSYAIAARSRAAGPLVDPRLQAVPFHSQVSFVSAVPWPFSPPNRTATCRTLSNAMADLT